MRKDLTSYTIRRKVFTILGASFHVYDGAGRLVGFSKQKAFKLREDIRIFADESMAEELLAIRARQIVDFSAAYDVVDTVERTKVGALRRKGWTSIFRDAWEVLDATDRPIAKLQEDSVLMATLRRFLSNLIPQKFTLTGNDGRTLAEMRVRFNPFVYKLDVNVHAADVVDPRLVLATGVLLAAVEGRQQS